MSAESNIKVLNIPYRPVEFLINREQCSSSIYIAETVPVETSCLFLDEGLKIGKNIIPLFNLDKFLQEYFHAEPAGEAHLALIRDVNSLSSDIQGKIADFENIFDTGNEKHPDKIAFRVASATIMMEIPLTALKLQPRVIAPHLEQEGLIAVSFTGEGIMRYVIDLDILFEKKILAALEGSNADTDS